MGDSYFLVGIGSECVAASITSTPLPSLEASAPSNSLFIHENGDNFELWVHPDLPNRSALVNRIKVVVTVGLR